MDGKHLPCQAQRAALNQYDELLKRVADRDPSAVQEATAQGGPWGTMMIDAMGKCLEPPLKYVGVHK